MAASGLAPAMGDFIQRFQTLKHHQMASEKLIEDVLIYCRDVETQLRQENEELNEQFRNMKLDLMDARDSRRDLQQRLLSAKDHTDALLQENDQIKNCNPYVLILIDGDGLIFQEHLVRQGLEGGKKAAYALRAAVAEHCNSRVNGMEIIARVVANVSGLAKAMVRVNALNDEQTMREFAAGFSQAQAAFDFIDVGYGKERADSKIKETTRWHLGNWNCKQILLGSSHDAGYAPFLDEILQDESSRQRVTLLEGVPAVNELKATNVNLLNLGASTLFRQDKLPTVKAGSRAPPAAVENIVPAQRVWTPAASSASDSPPPPASATLSYANVTTTRASPPPKLSMPFPPKRVDSGPNKKVAASSTPDWRPGYRGLDPPVTFQSVAMESIKSRKEHAKLCNNHFLRGPCTRVDVCPFVHNYKASKDELQALAYLARLNPCTRAQDCEMDNCIYGHNCPSTRDGTCPHPHCKFPIELHPPGTKFKNPYIKDN